MQKQTLYDILLKWFSTSFKNDLKTRLKVFLDLPDDYGNTKDDLELCDVNKDFKEDYDYTKGLIDPDQEIINIYTIKFDLSKLADYTKSGKTKSVKLYADVVYMTKDLHIDYELSIVAKKAVLDKRITMTIDLQKFLDKSGEIFISH